MFATARICHRLRASAQYGALDNDKLRRVYGLELPDWRKSLKECCARLIPEPGGHGRHKENGLS